jgi:hypothetical protein
MHVDDNQRKANTKRHPLSALCTKTTRCGKVRYDSLFAELQTIIGSFRHLTINAVVENCAITRGFLLNERCISRQRVQDRPTDRPMDVKRCGKYAFGIYLQAQTSFKFPSESGLCGGGGAMMTEIAVFIQQCMVYVQFSRSSLHRLTHPRSMLMKTLLLFVSRF